MLVTATNDAQLKLTIMNIKKLFLIALIILQPIKAAGYGKIDREDCDALIVLGVYSVIIGSVIVAEVYKYLYCRDYCWDYSKQKSNLQKLDFLLKSHEQAGQIEDLINYLHDPSKHIGKKQKYSKGILFSGDMGSLLVQALSNELSGQCFYIDVLDFIGKYEINSVSGRITNLKQSAGRVTSFFNYIQRQRVPCLIVFKNLECLVPQTFSYSYENIQLEKYINEEIEAIKNQLLIEIEKVKNIQEPIVCSAMMSDDKTLPKTLNPAFSHAFNNWYSLNVRTTIVEHLFKVILKYTDISAFDLALRTLNLTEEKLLLLREQMMNNIVIHTDKIKVKATSEIIDDFVFGKVQNNDESELTAYHESGHAIISLLYDNQFMLDKVSILSRSNHLGITQNFRLKIDSIDHQQKILNEICMYLAGYAGEEMFVSKKTLWLESSDYKKAYELASIIAAENKDSDPTKIINQEYARALKLLKQYEKEFKALAQALIEHKVLMADEIYTILNNIQ